MTIEFNIPTYNYTGGLARTLEISRLPELWKIRVFDDSTEQSVKIFTQNYSKKISYYLGAKTGNPIDNWNKGLDLAVSKGTTHIVTMHHDEYLLHLSDKIESYSFDPAVVYVFEHRVGARTIMRSKMKCLLINFMPKLVIYANFIGPTACVVVPASSTQRFDRRLRWLVDSEYYYRLAKQYKFKAMSGVSVATDTKFDKTITSQLNSKLKIAREELLEIGESANILKILTAKVFVKIVSIFSA